MAVAVTSVGHARMRMPLLGVGGRLTFFLDDGWLNYAAEQVFETYHALSPLTGPTASFRFQRIKNLGYNADRDPASFFGLRLHVEN